MVPGARGSPLRLSIWQSRRQQDNLPNALDASLDGLMTWQPALPAALPPLTAADIPVQTMPPSADLPAARTRLDSYLVSITPSAPPANPLGIGHSNNAWCADWS